MLARVSSKKGECMKILKVVGALVIIGLVLTFLLKLLWILLPVIILVVVGLLVWKLAKQVKG